MTFSDWKHLVLFNPLITESDKHLKISPFNITPESNIKVMRKRK